MTSGSRSSGLTGCKKLASMLELNSAPYRSFMERLNKVAALGALQQYETYCRTWEYPWLWRQIEPLQGTSAVLVDIGSERSPFAWLLAGEGFDVTVSDVSAQYWRTWSRARSLLGLSPRRAILDAQALSLATASVDIYLSVSVVEHVPDKTRAFAEAARVLRPGGLLAMTFDICEPDLGMSFPAWNGRALTMAEFDALVGSSLWFEALPETAWNREDIEPFLAWHRTTAPHHNYVAAGAVLIRNGRHWPTSGAAEAMRRFRRMLTTTSSVTVWYVSQASARLTRRHQVNP